MAGGLFPGVCFARISVTMRWRKKGLLRVAIFGLLCLCCALIQKSYAGSRLDKINDRFVGTIPPPPVLDLELAQWDWRGTLWGGYEDFKESSAGWALPTTRTNGPVAALDLVIVPVDRVYFRGFASLGTPNSVATAGWQVGYQLLVGNQSDSSLTLAIGLASIDIDEDFAFIPHFSGHWAKQLDRDLKPNGIVFRHQVLAGLDVGYLAWDRSGSGERGLTSARLGAGWEFCWNGFHLSFMVDGSSNGNLRGLTGFGYRRWKAEKGVDPVAAELQSVPSPANQSE